MIPDEAVEVARWAYLTSSKARGTKDAWRAALEAAVPHLMAPVLALCDEADNRRGSSMYCKLTTHEVRKAIGVEL